MDLGYHRKDLLGLEDLTPNEIQFFLDTARSFKEILERPQRKVPTFRGKTVLSLFFEPSTRTRMSFELAAKRLSADTVSVAKATSSVKKGETLLDTMKNMEAMKVDVIILRHESPGAAHFLARHTEASVINAGDGPHEHPTQALLDLFTVREKLGTLEGIKLAIVGDILHSRVARSNLFGFTKMGAEVMLVGPPPLVPKSFERYGARISHSVDEALEWADVVMALRIQKERLGESFFGSDREYRRFFGITKERVQKVNRQFVLMHPGPVNWHVELDPEVVDLLDTVILEQVTNGVAIRMAILYALLARGGTSS